MNEQCKRCKNNHAFPTCDEDKENDKCKNFIEII